MAQEITDSNFEEIVTSSNQVVLIDFWAQWCGPCRAIAPIIEELSSEYEGRAVVGKIDVDQNQDIALKYNIRSIPTIIIVKDGEVAYRHVGSIAKSKLKAELDQQLNA